MLILGYLLENFSFILGYPAHILVKPANRQQKFWTLQSTYLKQQQFI